MRKFSLIFILFIIGCSHSGGDVVVSLVEFHDIKLEKKGFNQKLNSFQFFLKNSIEDMLEDLNHQEFGCARDMTLDISFESPDLYHDIKQKSKLQKKTISYKLHYTISDGKNSYSGKIKSTDSFIIPSNAYGYVISEEESEIAGVNNLTKQLEHELIGLIHNNCKEITYKR